MTPIVFAWLLSLSGAGLFFAAGDVWGRQRRTRNASGDLSTLGAELEATRAHMMDQERAKQELRAHETQLASELSQRKSESDQLRGQVANLQVRADSLEHELQSSRSERLLSGKPVLYAAQAVTESAELERELQRLKREHEAARARIAQVEAEATRLKYVETERDKLAQQLELAQTGGKAAALEQELGLTRETLSARDAQLEQLREETVRLHSVEADLERAKRELGELAEQTRHLRAEAYAANRTPSSRRPERPATISTRGDALQLIVDDETEHGGARSAVIADELGLVVASSGVVGEYGDALAAFGAYLADVGTKSRDVLPLHEVRQVVVRDDHDMTLTVRPLATEDPGLALVTLAIDMNAAVPMQGRPT